MGFDGIYGEEKRRRGCVGDGMVVSGGFPEVVRVRQSGEWKKRGGSIGCYRRGWSELGFWWFWRGRAEVRRLWFLVRKCGRMRLGFRFWMVKEEI
ncbi:hypothetical protein HAX54_015179, partial [Datura stramonium]|nr:hypothetical protein [Datura stramonium]